MGWQYLPIIFIALAASCAPFGRHEVSIINQSRKPLTDVRFAYADAMLERSVISPGEAVSFNPYPHTDGAISLSYAMGGDKFEHQLGYATPMISMTCDFEIEGEEIRGECAQR